LGGTVSAVDVDEIVPRREAAKNGAALADVDADMIAPGRHVGAETVEMRRGRAGQRLHRDVEDIDAVQPRARAGHDVLEQPTGGAPFVTPDLESRQAGATLSIGEQRLPQGDVPAEPIFIEEAGRRRGPPQAVLDHELRS